MQSVASLMSLGRPDIGNVDDFDEEEEPEITDLERRESLAKITQLANQFGILDTSNGNGSEDPHSKNRFSHKPFLCPSL